MGKTQAERMASMEAKLDSVLSMNALMVDHGEKIGEQKVVVGMHDARLKSLESISKILLVANVGSVVGVLGLLFTVILRR